MKNKIKYKIMLFIAIIIVSDSSFHLFFYWHSQQKIASEYQAKVDEIQPLLYYVGAIMGGYVETEESDPLSRYDMIDGDSYAGKVINNIYVDISPVKVDHDGKRGYVDVKYIWAYHNDSDPMAIAVSGGPSRWFIEKHEGGRWKVVRIAEEP